MLTECQKKSFIENRVTYEIFKETLGENFDFITSFFNSRDDIRIDIIAEISNEFCNKVPVKWVKKVMLEILQLEMEELEDIFFGEESIYLNDEISKFSAFVKKLEQYEASIKYDYSVLKLYVRYISIVP